MLRTLSEEGDAQTDTKLGPYLLTLLDTVSFFSVLFVLMKENFTANQKSLYRSNWSYGMGLGFAWSLGPVCV